MTDAPHQITLRRATVADLGEIITVQRAAFLVEAQLYGHPNLPPLRETIDEVRGVLNDGSRRSSSPSSSVPWVHASSV